MKNYNKQVKVYVPETAQELNTFLSAYEGCTVIEFQKGVDIRTFAPHIIYLIQSNKEFTNKEFVLVDVCINILSDKNIGYEFNKVRAEEQQVITKKEEVKNVASNTRKWYQFFS